MHRPVIKYLLVIVLMLILSSCHDRTKIINYIKKLDTAQIDEIYTNKLGELSKKLQSYEIRKIPTDLEFIKPYNNVVAILDSTIGDSEVSKYFPFAKVEKLKRSLIIDNSLTGVDVLTFLKTYSRKMNFPGRIFTNKPDRVKAFGNRVERVSRKCFGNPCKPNKNFKRLFVSEMLRVELGGAMFVYFYDTDTMRYPSIKQINKICQSCNIVRLKDGLVVLPDFFFSHAMIDTILNILSTDTLVRRIYTNRLILTKKLLKNKYSVSWLPRRYVRRKKNTGYNSYIANLKNLLDRDNILIIYFYRNDTIFPSPEEMEKKFSNHIFFYFSQGIVIRSKFYKQPAIIDSLIVRVINDTMVERVYTNKVKLLNSLITRDSIRIKIVWEPRKCVLKDTMCYPVKDFYSRMYRYKLDVEARRALWLHFNDVSQRTFASTKFLKSYLANSFDTETEDGVLFSSPYRNSQTLSSLKEKIIPVYYNPEFKIYSNKVYILKRLLDTSYIYFHLPVQYLLPSYERNEKLDLQLQNVKQDIIVNNAILVYLKDPTDSIYPSEAYIREKFKYLKFFNFKDGFVIGAYLGD